MEGMSNFKDLTATRPPDDLTAVNGQKGNGGVLKLVRSAGGYGGMLADKNSNKESHPDPKRKHRCHIHYILKVVEETDEQIEKKDKRTGKKTFEMRKRLRTIDDTYSRRHSGEKRKELSFVLGQDRVIKAWELLLPQMDRWETTRIEVKPEYHYGAEGNAELGIPPDATLVYIIELLRWDNEDLSPQHNESLTRTVVQPGYGEFFEMPQEGGIVTVHAIGYHDNRKLMDETITYEVGECGEHNLPEGIDQALKKFQKTERSLLHMKKDWSYGYGYLPKPELGLDAGVELDFDIELKDFVSSNVNFDTSVLDKVKVCQQLKNRALHFWNEGKIHLAVNKYERIIKHLEKDSNTEEAELQLEVRRLLMAAFLNMALAYQKKGEGKGLKEVVHFCNRALRLEPDNIKALYRRAQAYEGQGEYGFAVKDYQRVVETEPENRAARQRIADCRMKHRLTKEKDKQRFGKMFDKFAKTDAGMKEQEKQRKQEWAVPRSFAPQK